MPFDVRAPLAEAELLTRLRAGDPKAFEILVADHIPGMLALARGFLRDPGAVEAAVLDAFRMAFESVHRLPRRGPVAGWLRRIQIEACVAKLGSLPEAPEAPEVKEEGSIDELLPKFLDDGHQAEPASPWRAVPASGGERRKILLRVQGCLHELPASYRAVLLLRDVEGSSRSETASLLGWTEAEVDARLHRARIALRGLLAPGLDS